MASISINTEESPRKYLRQERRRFTALQPSIPSHEARSPIMILDQEDKCESMGEMFQPTSPTFNVKDKPSQLNRAVNRLLKARSPRGKKEEEKPEFISCGKKHDYFRSEAVVMNHPLVTKEMLQHDIALDNEEDHKVSLLPD